MVINLWTLLEFLQKLIKLEFIWKKEKPTNRCLLIVDDDKYDSELLGNYLVRCGCSFEVAHMAEVAQEMIRTKYYQIAFIDLRLPRMPGQRLIAELRMKNPAIHIVIVCGGAGGLSDVMTGCYVGLILKPVTLESVEEVLKKTKF